jgi:hypothetical protein
MRPKTKAVSPTKRSQLLGRALEFINLGQFRDLGDYLFFGDLEEYEGMYEPVAADELSQEVHSLASEIILHTKAELGRKASSERTAVGRKSSAGWDGVFRKYSPEAIERLGRALQAHWGREENASSPTTKSAVDEFAENPDNLDAYYATELLRKLPEIVSRVLRLEKIDAENVNDHGVQGCFRDAHQCYLYGFRAACAVMCRAILEHGLRDVMDPRGDLEFATKGTGASYIGELLRLAKGKGLIRPDSESWGMEVKRAGDWATHNGTLFDREYPPQRIEEVLLKTRHILNELYAK